MEFSGESLQTKSKELIQNLTKFTENTNNAAGTRARKNSMELIKMLKELRVEILTTQKERKTEKASIKKSE